MSSYITLTQKPNGNGNFLLEMPLFLSVVGDGHVQDRGCVASHHPYPNLEHGDSYSATNKARTEAIEHLAHRRLILHISLIMQLLCQSKKI